MNGPERLTFRSAGGIFECPRCGMTQSDRDEKENGRIVHDRDACIRALRNRLEKVETWMILHERNTNAEFYEGGEK
jgi:predicted RNA-binding Zn-ribbon protein involved in translation (DUF1610 family)